MKITIEGFCSEVRDKLTGAVESEIRFKVEKELCSFRVPYQLAFRQPVYITIETRPEDAELVIEACPVELPSHDPRTGEKGFPHFAHE